MQILEIMYLLNVQCVSVYAFAIDNFKRSPEEVNALMALAEERLKELCQHKYVPDAFTSHLFRPSLRSGLLQEYGVRLVAVGKTQYLPEGVKAAIKLAEELTKHNTRYAIHVGPCGFI